MKKIVINSDLKEKYKSIALGCIQYDVDVEKKNVNLWDDIERFINTNIINKIILDKITFIPEINDSREAYKSFGKEPNRYRISSESLLKRILQGKGLYQINSIVDLNNLISIKSCYSVGSYNISKIGNTIYFRMGKTGEKYKGIGKDVINLESLPIFSDDEKPFGSPTSDSEIAMITLDSKNILTIVISFSGKEKLDSILDEFEKYLKKYTNATNIEKQIIT